MKGLTKETTSATVHIHAHNTHTNTQILDHQTVLISLACSEFGNSPESLARTRQGARVHTQKHSHTIVQTRTVEKAVAFSDCSCIMHFSNCSCFPAYGALRKKRNGKGCTTYLNLASERPAKQKNQDCMHDCTQKCTHGINLPNLELGVSFSTENLYLHPQRQKESMKNAASICRRVCVKIA